MRETDARLDDEIMADFDETFPELSQNDEAIRKIDEDAMKSAAGKEKWRNFINKYEKKGRCRRLTQSPTSTLVP